MVKHVPKLRNFLTTVTDMINFLRDSPKRVAIVKSVAEALGCKQTHIRPLCPTRFTIKYKSLNSLKEQLQAVKDALVAIEDCASNRDIQSRADGFLRVISTFEFTICLLMSLSIFEVSDRLSTALQGSQVSAGQGTRLTQSAIVQLSKMRREEFFDQVWQRTATFAEQHSQDDPDLPRQSRAPRQYQRTDAHRTSSRPPKKCKGAFGSKPWILWYRGSRKGCHRRLLLC